MFYAMFAMILLTCVISWRLLALRVTAVKSGAVKLSAFRLNNAADMPSHLQQAARNFSNLFEVPMLFYVASTLALALHLETRAMVVLAWLFVASRALHSWIHITGNNVIRRMQAFMFGNFCLLLIWCLIAWQYTTLRV